jgi:Fe-S cluster biogenesis protein NfuA
MIALLEDALDEVRKTLRLHQGGIELVSWDEGTGELAVALTGSCAHCALSSITIKKGVEVVLCERVPSIRTIRVVNAHVNDRT